MAAGYESRFVRALHFLFSTQKRSISSLFGVKKEYGFGQFVPHRFYDLLSEHSVDFTFLKLLRLWACTIRRQVDGLHIVVEKFDVMFRDVNAAKMTVPHCFKCGRHVKEFPTVL